MEKTAIALVLLLALISCAKNKQAIDLQGHRGCRGLLPENTLEGFIKALEIGVTTLEMDVVISKDKQVVVSHEPFFSHEIATTPTGEPINEENETEHNMYLLTHDQIKQYDVGLRPHKRFPKQEKIAAVKPLLKDVIEAAEKFTTDNAINKPHYNIEIKRVPENDSIFHPSALEYVELVLEEVKSSPASARICLQSFDIQTLQIIKQLAPEITTALLVENEASIDQNMKTLGFIPDIYSPYFELITDEVMDYCKKHQMLIIPWTVNEQKDVLRMIELKVDGIISDYPDRVKKILEEQKISVK